MFLLRLLVIIGVLHYIVHGRKRGLARDRRRVRIRPTESLVVIGGDGRAFLQLHSNAEPPGMLSYDTLRLLHSEHDATRLEPELEESNAQDMQTARSCSNSHHGPGPHVVVDEKSQSSQDITDKHESEFDRTGKITGLKHEEEAVVVVEKKSRSDGGHIDEEFAGASLDDDEMIRDKDNSSEEN